MKWILFAIQAFPLVIDAVQAVEKVFAGEGKGQSKLAAVLASIESVYEAIGVKDLPQESVTKLVVAMINRVVGLFNATGVFKSNANAGA